MDGKLRVLVAATEQDGKPIVSLQIEDIQYVFHSVLAERLGNSLLGAVARLKEAGLDCSGDPVETHVKWDGSGPIPDDIREKLRGMR